MNDHDRTKIAAMREGGKVLGSILEELLVFAHPGVTLLEIETLAQKRIREAGMKPSFSTVADYRWATCLCVNDVIVHGIPTAYQLKDGDVLTIDIGLINASYHVDTAWTKVMRESKKNMTDPKLVEFLNTGERALSLAIGQALPGNRVGHISEVIEREVRKKGYGIVKSLVGHGVGTMLHEPPQIPGVLKGPVDKTPPLLPGMTIAIEVIYTMGNPAVVYFDDGWSIATRDHSVSAVFEQTVAVTDDGMEILTPKPVV